MKAACDDGIAVGMEGSITVLDSSLISPATDCSRMSDKEVVLMSPARDSMFIEEGALSSKERVGDSNLEHKENVEGNWYNNGFLVGSEL